MKRWTTIPDFLGSLSLLRFFSVFGSPIAIPLCLYYSPIYLSSTCSEGGNWEQEAGDQDGQFMLLVSFTSSTTFDLLDSLFMLLFVMYSVAANYSHKKYFITASRTTNLVLFQEKEWVA